MKSRGFTLLIAVVIASVATAIGFALATLAYKEVILAVAGKQSHIAFYAANSALECGLYWDEQQNAFDFTNPLPSIACAGQSVPITTISHAGGERVMSVELSFEGGVSCGRLEIHKASSGATTLYALGYNTCDQSAPNRIERGLKASY